MPISELVVYGLIVAGVVLFNFVLQMLANRSGRQENETYRAPPQPVAKEVLDYRWGGAATALPPAHLPQRAPVDTSAAPPLPWASTATRLHPAVRRLLRDRREMHHAIVLRTVVGPCRALEPYDDPRR